MLWTQRKKNAKQRKIKCIQGYLDRLRRCRESIEKKPTSMDRESVKDMSSRQRAQDFGSMDRLICRETIKDAEKRFFKGEKHIR